jgi:hypothetical protein
VKEEKKSERAIWTALAEYFALSVQQALREVLGERKVRRGTTLEADGIPRLFLPRNPRLNSSNHLTPDLNNASI